MLNIMQNKIVGVNNELDSPEILVKKESLGSKNKNFEINLQTSPKRQLTEKNLQSIPRFNSVFVQNVQQLQIDDNETEFTFEDKRKE